MPFCRTLAGGFSHSRRQKSYECVEVMCWPPSKAERRYAGVTHIDVVSSDRTARENQNWSRKPA